VFAGDCRVAVYYSILIMLILFRFRPCILYLFHMNLILYMFISKVFNYYTFIFIILLIFVVVYIIVLIIINDKVNCIKENSEYFIFYLF